MDKFWADIKLYIFDFKPLPLPILPFLSQQEEPEVEMKGKKAI